MSWMDNIERIYFFKCDACGHESGILRAKFDPESETSLMGCEKCAQVGKLKYTGWDNAEDFKLSTSVTKVSYDQNGRKAYKIGNTYMSKTKYNYMETGKVQNEYTASYEAKLMEDKEKNEHLLQTETNTKRAIVTELKRELTRRAHAKPGSRTVPQK